MNLERVQQLVYELLQELGEDPEREGLKRTPERVAKAWEFLTRGYRSSPEAVLNQAVFRAPASNMVIVRNIEIFSLCEHHLLPFYGKCHVGYVARNKVLGVSKIARLADVFARRLQIQERLTEEIAGAIMEATDALGVGVVMEAKHLCMMMRGVEKQHSSMVTSSVLGSFRRDSKTREEFLNLIAASGA
ncbi:MAG: GTP cyclohydrolase I FolE [Spirochaetales bacterium]|nr:GTP cyclohydrolase I FolE [Spirochaetales bacterium]